MLSFRSWRRQAVLLVAHMALIFLLSAGTIGICLASPAQAQSEPEINPDVILVGVKEGASENEISALLDSQGLHLEQYWPTFALAAVSRAGATLAAASSSSLQAAGATLAQSDLVRYVTPDQRIYAANRFNAPAPSLHVASQVEPPLVEPDPNDPRFSEQYAFENMDIIKAWNITKGSEDVVIGVIDSGYDSGHSDINESNIWANQAELAGEPGVDDDNNGFVDDVHGWDWVEDDNTTNDPYGHGTHVSGVIVATSNNEIGVSGMAPKLRVAPLRVLDQRGGGFISDLVNALAYAETFDFPIVNLSLVIISDSPAIYDAVRAAREAGIVVVAATGNISSLVQWPAAYPETVAVAATDAGDARAGFSGQGTAVDVAAPGVSILSTYRDNAYAELSGTSMATPQVSALLGLLLSLRPDLSADELVALLKGTADDVNSESLPGPDSELGTGRINFYAALLAASEPLAIDPASPSDRYIGFEEDAIYSVSITAPDSLPVAGATVFVTPTLVATEIGTRIRMQSDKNGRIFVPLESPEQPGLYTFDVQVGAAFATLPVTIYTAPMTLTLTMSTAAIQAGEQDIPFQIHLYDQTGAPQAGPVPVLLATTRGEFDNGVQKTEVVVSDGVYTGSLHAGSTIGAGQFSASIGSLTDTVNVRILPGAPAHLSVVDQFLPEVSDASTRQYRLTFSVTDAFGNAVLDDTLVRVSTSEGKLTPTEVGTVNGEAVTQLALPSGTTMATVTAEIPGTGLQETITIATGQTLLWLPMISNQ